MQIVINAGGIGTRLWPISTNQIPKQFCKLVGNDSLLQIAFNRVKNLVPIENIWVNVNQKHLSLAKKQLPQVLDSRFLSEPSRRDTFAAVISHASVVAGHTKETENIVFLSSDHYIAPQSSIENFCEGLKIIDRDLNKEYFDLMVAGAKPTFASTQYGYIQVDPKEVKTTLESAVKVLSFKEKPNFEVASEFLEAGNYFWNLGLFAFKYNHLVKMLEEFYPKLVSVVENIRASKTISNDLFEQIPVNSIDYALIEKTKHLGMVGISMKIWEDIGNFETYSKYLQEVPSLDQQIDKDSLQIQVLGTNNRIKLLDKNKKVAFVGVSNLVVAESEEGLIIINPEKSSEVKKVAGYFEGL